MHIKTFLLIAFIFLFQNMNAQETYIHTFGEPLQEEYALNKYTPDLEASGVVLYERGNYTIDAVGDYIRIIKHVHVKMKVFNAKDFKHATIKIPYYLGDKLQENVTNIKAITHNGKTKEFVSQNAVFDAEESQYWSQKKFAFPNVRDGSILEYSYQIESPYFAMFGGWEFMNPLPTIYSELHTEIPGNFNYNRTLYGDRELDVNKAEIKKDCFHLPGFRVPGDCESATYVMKNVPAFTEEKYMLAPSNYMPALKYELVEIIDLNESRDTYAKTWKDVDRRFKNDKDLGRQLKYSEFFKGKLPQDILTISDDIERATAVYHFIQKNMNWNKKVRIFSDIRVKEAFEEGVGNSSEINLALINSLEAAGLDAKIMMIATRDVALPSKQYPILTDFNYAIVFLQINNQKFILDATDKYTPFGVLPMRDLNVEGRVLDFKKGSYWEPIAPIAKNLHYVNMQLTADNQGIFKGKINEVSTGYISVGKRKKNNDYSKEENTKRKQQKNEGLNISDLTIENAKDLELPYKESYNISLHEQVVADRLFIYPFLMQTYFTENPFLKESRKYPIDFGFPVINNYLISIDVKDQYEILSAPENKLMRLPNNDGELSVVYDVSGTKINIRLSLKLNNHSFPTGAYQSLREFFTELIKIQSEEPITLKKI